MERWIVQRSVEYDMTSKKSANTLDRETSQRVTKAAQAADAKRLLREADAVIGKLRAELEAAKAEASRKETWINRYAEQLKAARKKIAQLEGGADRPVSERRAAMAAAKAEAMRTGRTVAVQ